MCESEFESGLDLVVGRKYKVCLKPFDELLDLGLAVEWDKGYTWYEDYLGCDVGWVIAPSQEGYSSVKVLWSTGKGFLYHLEELKILGEV